METGHYVKCVGLTPIVFMYPVDCLVTLKNGHRAHIYGALCQRCRSDPNGAPRLFDRCFFKQ